MHIDRDFSYITDTDKKLIELGFADLSVSAIIFDRFFTESEKQHNYDVAHSMTDAQFSEQVKSTSLKIHNQLKNVLGLFSGYSLKGRVNMGDSGRCDFSTLCPGVEYDNPYYDYLRIEPHYSKTVCEINNICDDIYKKIATAKIDAPNICARFQMTVRKDNDAIWRTFSKIVEQIKEKPIIYKNMPGKIRPVFKGQNSMAYGFFKKGARNRYYLLDLEYIVANFTV